MKVQGLFKLEFYPKDMGPPPPKTLLWTGGNTALPAWQVAMCYVFGHQS
jgi:hypothetical protein